LAFAVLSTDEWVRLLGEPRHRSVAGPSQVRAAGQRCAPSYCLSRRTPVLRAEPGPTPLTRSRPRREWREGGTALLWSVALRRASRCTPDTGVCVLSVSLSGKVTLFVSFSVRRTRSGAPTGEPIDIGHRHDNEISSAPARFVVRGSGNLPPPHIGVCEARQVDDPLDQPERRGSVRDEEQRTAGERALEPVDEARLHLAVQRG